MAEPGSMAEPTPVRGPALVLRARRLRAARGVVVAFLVTRLT